MKVTNWKVYDLDESVIASGYPMRTELEPKDVDESDIGRATKLANAKGGGHNQFLSGILVSFDLTCSNKMWVEERKRQKELGCLADMKTYSIANAQIRKMLNCKHQICG